MIRNLASAPFFIVSPHLDDAVFSCAMLLASHPGSIVCTVFCGAPVPAQHTPWDRLAGHRDSSDALRARIAEDERALAIVGARAIRLPFFDSQYGSTPSIEELVRAIAHAWRRSGSARFVAPLGLYHSDHVRVGDACRSLLRTQRPPNALFYEDALYRAMAGVARERYVAIEREGYALRALDAPSAASLRRPGAAAAKWRAVHAYRSQLRALDDAHPHDLVEPERYVVIDPTPLARRP
ncbi:MAG: PIG-L deacetylase family protein [Trinickia sp.]|jgi:LmbE family N-acetylglucosaminyl deacetylase